MSINTRGLVVYKRTSISYEIYFASGILIFGSQLLSVSLNEELGFIYLFSHCQSRFFDYWVYGNFCTVRNRSINIDL